MPDTFELSLGPCEVFLESGKIGECDNINLEITEATVEEINLLKDARVIILHRTGEMGEP